MKEILPYAGFLAQAVFFAFFMGKLTSRVKTLEDDKTDKKETLKRIHERLDTMSCVTKDDCHTQSQNFETRLESYQNVVCTILNEIKKNQVETDKTIIMMNEQIIHISKEITEIKEK